MAPTADTSPSQDDSQRDPTESTPLLTHSEQTPIASNIATDDVGKSSPPVVVPDTKAGNDESKEDEFPKGQILLLCYASIFEPIAFFSIFPFVNQMIYNTGEVAESDVGFYSGLIESLFSLVQMVFMVPWGRLADHPRIGRKPVLIFTTFGLTFFMAIFGMSQTIWQMILFRCLAGCFGGNTPIMRTMISENCTSKTQARAFSWYAFVRNFGIFLGPLVGGVLADPAHQYPGAFGSVKFFQQYPYALPSYAGGLIGLSSGLLILFFAKETLPSKINGATTPVNDAASSDDDPKMSTWELLRSPGVTFIVYLYGHIMVLAFAYTAVMPVFYWEPVRLGGIGFKPLLISVAMGVGGLAQSIWLLVVFPYIQKRYSTGAVIRLCANAYPFFFVINPLCSILRRRGFDIAFWIVGSLSVILGSGVAMSFTAAQLAVNDVNPHPTTLGTLNALVLAFTAGLRAFSPALFTSIFAFGVRKQILGGYLVWVIMTVLAAGITLSVRFLPANAEGKVKVEGHEDEEL